MKALNCESYRLTILFDEKDFKVEDFKRDSESEDDTENSLAFNFNSKNKRKKEHAHLIINFDNEDSILRAGFHQGKLDDDEDDLSGITAENFLKELASYFTDDNVRYFAIAYFEYTDKYEPLITLNYPFLSNTKHLQGAEITGYDMKLPKDSAFRRLSISNDSVLRLSVQKIGSLKLSEFNHYSEIETFIPLTQELVSEKGGNNDEHSEK